MVEERAVGRERRSRENQGRAAKGGTAPASESGSQALRILLQTLPAIQEERVGGLRPFLSALARDWGGRSVLEAGGLCAQASRFVAGQLRREGCARRCRDDLEVGKSREELVGRRGEGRGCRGTGERLEVEGGKRCRRREMPVMREEWKAEGREGGG